MYLRIHPTAPQDLFPEPVTFCLTGINTLANDAGDPDARLFVLDACQGFLIQLDRQRL